MSREIVIYFITDDVLTDVLKKLGMLEDAEAGRLRCYLCGKSVGMQNIGGIFKHGGQIRIVCNDIKCLYQAAWQTAQAKFEKPTQGT
jgi:hypothetical protein